MIKENIPFSIQGICSCYTPYSGEVHKLHPVADAEDGNPQFKYLPGTYRGAFLINTRRTSGEDDPFGTELLYLRQRRIEGHDLRIDLRLSDTPCDKLRILGAKIKDQYLVCVDVFQPKNPFSPI